MSRGCHSCSVNLSDYERYEDSPCASCFLSQEYSHTHNMGLFDNINTADVEDFKGSTATLTTEQEELLAGLDTELETFDAIKQACEAQMLITMSNVCLKIIKLMKRNPTTIGILLRKWQFPYMSYSDIGASMNPKCSKQNVLYHLKQAVQFFPELEHLILTDTRFSGGRYALRTVAAQNRANYINNKLRQALYGDNPMLKINTMKQVSALLDAPCNIPDDIVDFDLYTQEDNDAEQANDAKN